MLQYLKNSWDGIWTVLIGMKITFKHLFVPAVTIQYPDVKVQLPDRVRNRLYVNMDDCIGCDQCSRACPVSCIEIETVKGLPTDDIGVTSNGKKKALWVTKFNIDFAKCCYCQLCVFPCPTDCIYMTDVYEFSEFERNDLIYNFSTLTPDEAEEKKANFEKMQAEKEAQKEAAAKAKAAVAAKKEAETKTEPKPAAEKPKTDKPETGKPETGKPETNKPETNKPDNKKDKSE